MNYIDKCDKSLQERGIKETQSIIDSCWNEEESRYVNLDYQRAMMHGMEKILIEGQCERDGSTGLCCYCMRKLYLDQSNEHRRNTTIEHIIPEKIQESDWIRDKSCYQIFESLKENYVKVCFGGKLPDTKKRIHNLPYPHFLSYHNMVLSCDGKSVNNGGMVLSNCCNNKRGNSFVLPMYLLNDVSNRISYTKEGDIDFDDDFKEEWFYKQLNLQSEWLKRVRRFWYLLSKSEYSDYDVDCAINSLELRNNILDDIDNESTLMETFNNTDRWVLLSEYSWFFDYYKNH